jgi:hypothetical protein
VAVQLEKETICPARICEKSPGIETPKRDVELIKQRYKEAKELATHEEK